MVEGTRMRQIFADLFSIVILPSHFRRGAGVRSEFKDGGEFFYLKNIILMRLTLIEYFCKLNSGL